MVHLVTCEIDKFLNAVAMLAADHGRWMVAASVYSAARSGFSVRVGCRACAWLPLGREMVIYDSHTEVTVGSADAQAAERDFNAAVAQVESAAKKLKLRYLPFLLDWVPESAKGGAR